MINENSNIITFTILELVNKMAINIANKISFQIAIVQVSGELIRKLVIHCRVWCRAKIELCYNLRFFTLL